MFCCVVFVVVAAAVVLVIVAAAVVLVIVAAAVALVIVAAAVAVDVVSDRRSMQCCSRILLWCPSAHLVDLSGCSLVANRHARWAEC